MPTRQTRLGGFVQPGRWNTQMNWRSMWKLWPSSLLVWEKNPCLENGFPPDWGYTVQLWNNKQKNIGSHNYTTWTLTCKANFRCFTRGYIFSKPSCIMFWFVPFVFWGCKFSLFVGFLWGTWATMWPNCEWTRCKRGGPTNQAAPARKSLLPACFRYHGRTPPLLPKNYVLPKRTELIIQESCTSWGW